MDSIRSQGLRACDRLAVVVACNDDEILESNLMRSPMIALGGIPVHVERGAASAGIAYNRGLSATSAELVVFAHQDVYLPLGWETLLHARIAELQQSDPDWALLGSYGVDDTGAHYGPVWSSSIGSIIGRISPVPIAVQSFDEHLFVMRRSAGFAFDENLPGFHLYGTDIVQMVRKSGRGAYVMPLPLIHNDRFKGQLGNDYLEAFRYMQRKWKDVLPLVSPVAKISWHGLQLARSRWRNMRSRVSRREIAAPTECDPRVYADLCGWSDVTFHPHGKDVGESSARAMTSF